MHHKWNQRPLKVIVFRDRELHKWTCSKVRKCRRNRVGG